MSETTFEEWDIWYPQAGATGLPFARGRIAGAEVLLVHAAPAVMTVTVRDHSGKRMAEGKDLAATAETPLSRLTRTAAEIKREDIWPTAAELGQLVLLAGGEVGALKTWWHAADYSEWRWQIELYNRR